MSDRKLEGEESVILFVDQKDSQATIDIGAAVLARILCFLESENRE
jgi:hypothetical protein